MEFRRACTISKTFCFEFANPLLHAAPAAIHLLIHILSGCQRQFSGIAFILKIFRIDDAGLNQAQIELTGNRIKALAGNNTPFLLPAFGVPVSLTDDLHGGSCCGVPLHPLTLGVFKTFLVDGLLGGKPMM